MARKDPNSFTPPPAWRVLLGVFFMLLIGAGFGLYRLAQQPVVVESDPAKIAKLAPGTKIVQTGTELKGEGWEPKRGQFIRGEGELLALGSPELNRWSTRYLRIADKDWKPVQIATIPVNLRMTSPNFRVLDNGQLQIVTTLQLPDLRPNTPYVYVARGRFYRAANSEEIFFGVDESFLNEAPLSVVGPLQQNVITALATPFLATDEGQRLVKSWPSVHGVEIDATTQQLKLSLAQKP